VLAALGVASRPLALAMFVCGAFVVFSVGQEFWRGVRVRRAMSGDGPLAALVALVGRNRRRYGGYLVHVGMAVLFIGIAASTAFNDTTDVRMNPGDKATVGGYEFTYVKPTSDAAFSGAGNIEKISFGAVVTIRKDGKTVATLRPERGYYPSRDSSLGAVGRYFEGEATSEVGLKGGMRRDLWTAMTPNIRELQPVIDEADKAFGTVAGRLNPDQAGALLGRTLRLLIDRYERQPPPATFRLITSPMVTWIWIGALIVIGGGLIAMWPAPDAARRRASARLAARVAEDLGRTETRTA